MLEKIIAIMLSLVILLSPIVGAKAYSTLICFYWYSNYNSVGIWWSTPSVSRINCGGNVVSTFTLAFNQAKSKWASAGRSFNLAGSSPNADIVFYGGTRSQILAQTGYSVSIAYNGVTLPTATFSNQLQYNGTMKSLMSMQRAIVYIPDPESGSFDNQYYGTFLHEMGHAIGWLGHSTVSADVMYTYSNGVIVLTQRDKLQVLQDFM